MKFTARGKNRISRAIGTKYTSSSFSDKKKYIQKSRCTCRVSVIIEGTKKIMRLNLNKNTGLASFCFQDKDAKRCKYISGKIIDGIFYPNKESKNYPLFLKWVENYGNIESE